MTQWQKDQTNSLFARKISIWRFLQKNAIPGHFSDLGYCYCAPFPKKKEICHCIAFAQRYAHHLRSIHWWHQCCHGALLIPFLHSVPPRWVAAWVCVPHTMPNGSSFLSLCTFFPKKEICCRTVFALHYAQHCHSIVPEWYHCCCGELLIPYVPEIWIACWVFNVAIILPWCQFTAGGLLKTNS